jgi:hypothetical protein
MIVVLGIRDILWPKKAPPGGGLIRKRLAGFLEAQFQVAPQAGPGAYLRRFIRHAKRVTTSYREGLFHCYDDPRIPQTSNAIEHLFGKGKRLLRACGGRKSTAAGPGSSGGSFFLYTVAFHDTTPRAERENLLMQFSREKYSAARAKQVAIRGPEARRRRYARTPDAVLDQIGARWERTRF